MAEIDFAILADYVKEQDGLLHIIGAGVNRIYARSVPAAHRTGLGLKIEIPWVERDRDHQIELIFMGEDGQQLTHAVLTTKANIPSGHRLGTPIMFLMAADFVLPLPAYGAYSLEIMIDGTLRKSMRVDVAPIPELESAPGAGS